MLRNIMLFFISLSVGNLCLAQNPNNPSTFNSYLQQLKKEAAFKGFDSLFLDSVFPQIIYYESATEKDKSQPEFTKPFSVYYKNLVNDTRLEEGRKLYKKNSALLKKVKDKTGVSGKYLIAFWGVETNFGKTMGTYDILSTTATMAYDGRREEFFKNEFFTALKILRDDHIKREDFKGSWAGAFGNFQFMPTTFNAYKLSFKDGDPVNIVKNLDDAFLSAGNYLNKMKWKKDEKWGRIVKVPASALMDDIVDSQKPIKFFKDLGITAMDGKQIPAPSDMNGRLILPSGATGPAFLVYENFDKILRWNRSNFYALSVVLLADQIESGKPIYLSFENERRFNTEEIENVQKILKKQKFYDCKIDGVMGKCMKNAIKDYQKANNLPIDGYLGADLYHMLISN